MPDVPLAQRIPFLVIERCRLEVADGRVVAASDDTAATIPVGTLACLIMEPGVTVTHAAVTTCAASGCLLIWAGAGCTRLYAAADPGLPPSDRLMHQILAYRDGRVRARVMRAMFADRFGSASSVVGDDPDVWRGMEGARMRDLYAELAAQHGVPWAGRRVSGTWETTDPLNRAISAANHCLYGIVEAVLLTVGWHPAIGFLHAGKPLSFVYDIADLVKRETSLTAAFAVIAAGTTDPERDVRHRLRDLCASSGLMGSIADRIDRVMGYVPS